MKPAASARQKRVTRRDFATLVSFLTDASESTVSLAESQIKAALRANPRLRSVLASVSDIPAAARAELIAEGLWFDEAEPLFRKLLRKRPNADLEEGLCLLAGLGRPEVSREAIGRRLDEMAAAVDRMIAAEPALPTRPLHALRRYLFDLQGFRTAGAAAGPDAWSLERALETRVGAPLTLASIYLLVGWRLGLLAHGIGLPGHFIVGHRVPRGVVLIDPAQRGRVLRKKDCEVMVRRAGTTFKEEYLDPVTNRQILARTIAGLINVSSDQGARARAYWLARLYRIIEE